MTLAPFSAVPIEAENALPGTPGVYNHMYSDGPYQQVSYTPKKEIKFTRNPVWQASSDPLRKAYVDAINVDETGNQTTIYQQMPTGSPSLGMSFDALVPPADTPNLLNQIKSGSHNVNLGATYSSNPYLVFNTVSPNNGSALGKADVRQALSYGIQRSQLQKVLGGPIVNPPLTHVLPAGIDGSQGVPGRLQPVPVQPGQGQVHADGRGFHREPPAADQVPVPQRQPGQHGDLQQRQQPAERARLGEGDRRDRPTSRTSTASTCIVPNTKSAPSPAYKGTWDMASAGWGPDWYGNSALTFFNPLYSSPGGFPANGGSNFGYFSSTAVNNLINQALSQPTEAEADKFWAQADQQVMKEAAIYPITSPLQLAEHAPYVHNAVYMTQWQNFDPANVWLSKPGSS